MKRRLKYAALAILLLTGSFAAAEPKIVRVKAPRMPLVRIAIMFPFGTADETVGLRGATMTLVDWIEQGSKSRSGDQISNELLKYGATYSIEVRTHYSVATLEAPESSFGKALDVILDQLRDPKLADDDFKGSLSRTLAYKTARLANPLGVVRQLAYAALYGGTTEANADAGTDEDLSKLTAASTRRLYDGTIKEGPAAVFVSESAPKDIIGKIRSAFGPWSSEYAVPKLPNPTIRGKNLIILDRPDGTQTYLAFVKAGPTPGTQDHFLASISTQLLGGNGEDEALLFRELRSKRGLTYHASIQTSKVPDGNMLVGLTFGANSNVEKLATGYLEVWSSFVADRDVGADKLAEGARAINVRWLRQNETLADAFDFAVRSYAVTLKPEMPLWTAPAKAAEYIPAKDRWLSNTDVALIAIGKAAEIKDVLVKALGGTTKVVVLDPSADWDDISSAISKLNATH